MAGFRKFLTYPVRAFPRHSADNTTKEVNAKGTFLVARALANVSKGKDATFIHTGTAASYFASPEQSTYTAAKAASNMIVEQLHAGKEIPPSFKGERNHD